MSIKKHRKKDEPPFTVWLPNGTPISRESVETETSNNPSREFVISEKGLDYEEKARQEREIHKGNFISAFLREQEEKLGRERFNKNREKLIKEAEKAYEQKQAEIEAIYRRDQQEREKRTAKLKAAEEIRIQWQNPSQEFLEKTLLVSRSERERTLIYYSEAVSGIREAFTREFYKLLLNHLDKIEGRKLQP